MNEAKTFNFRNGVSGKFNVKKLLSIYHSINKLDAHFLCLVYLTSERFRAYVQENLPDYFSRLDPDEEGYEDFVFNVTSSLSYDLAQEEFGNVLESMFDDGTVNQNIIDFLDVEMTMWIKWAYNKHTETGVPVHLIRYMVGTSII